MWMEDEAINTNQEEADDLWRAVDSETRDEYRNAFRQQRAAYLTVRRAWEQSLFQAFRDLSPRWVAELDRLQEQAPHN